MRLSICLTFQSLRALSIGYTVFDLLEDLYRLACCVDNLPGILSFYRRSSEEGRHLQVCTGAKSEEAARVAARKVRPCWL